MSAVIFFLSGIYFEDRILSEMSRENLISGHNQQIFFVLLLIFKTVFVFWLPKTLFFLCVLSLTPVFSIKFIGFFAKRSQIRRFENNFLHFLNLLLLIMKSGKGFSASFPLAIKESNPIYRQHLTELYNHIFFSNQNDKKSNSTLLTTVLSDLSRAAKATHNSVSLVTNLRDRLQAQKILKEKVNVLCQQSRLQASVLTLLYLGLVAFSMLNFGFKQNSAFFVISFLLFAVGAAWLCQLGRKIRWKI